MRFIKILISVLTVCFLVSCSGEGECYNAHKKLMEMKSYTADVVINVNGNRSKSTYKAKQTFMEPNYIKIETIEPKELNGKKIVYNGDKWKVYHPLIKDIVEFTSLKSIDEVMYMGIIHKSFIMSDNIKERNVEKNGTGCIEFKAPLPNGNDHRSYAKLYVNKSSNKPILLEVYNKEDKVTFDVQYLNFEYNSPVDKDQFKLTK
ncbi:MAG: hypothetical protein RSA01_06795 [Clostridium sp.]|uniref:hypothetical protein n=1 Tax=Clostridium sp. TaxID=1506 RepID=UPI002FCC0A0E